MEENETLLAQQVVRLQALLEASRQLHSTIQLEEVLDTVLQIVVRELELTGAFFTTYQQTYGEVPYAIKERISLGRESIFDKQASQFLRFPLHDKKEFSFTELVVLFPIDRRLGIEEIDFLESLSVQASVAIENARFHQRALQWQRVETDLAAARMVQLSLIPQQIPQILGYQLAFRSLACYEVGGDYLDIVPTSSGEIIFVVGDVAGKGLASALVGASFRSAFRAMVHSGLSLCEIGKKINALHYNEGIEAQRRYVTSVVLQLSPVTHILEVLNSGHNPVFLMDISGDICKISASGPPIGLLPSSTYVSEKFEFLPGTKLLAYTDGMTEASNNGEEFGEARLLDNFLVCNQESAQTAMGALWKAIEDFSRGQDQSDDMTALMLFRGLNGECH
jgi:serine phosphatase RsbU (regulator of sigma subunit)